MNYDAVLFDLDGTLLDTLEDIACSMNQILKDLGCPLHAIHEYRYFLGEGVEQLVRRALPEARRDDATVARCAAALHARDGLGRVRRTKPYPGIPELLAELPSRGVRMAVLSNKPDRSAKSIVTRLLSRWTFEQVIGAGPSLPLKPNPAVALRIASLMRIPPERYIYVGDTEIDMQTARAARMRPAGVLWGFRTEEELRASGAELLLAKPADLLMYLG